MDFLQYGNKPRLMHIALGGGEGWHIATILNFAQAFERIVDSRHGEEFMRGNALLAEGVEAFAKGAEMGEVGGEGERIECSRFCIGWIISNTHPPTGSNGPSYMQS